MHTCTCTCTLATCTCTLHATGYMRLPNVSAILGHMTGHMTCHMYSELFLIFVFSFQIILNHVAMEMNRMLEIFHTRNPGFTGAVSVLGHSLGSVILFDLLSHQVY